VRGDEQAEQQPLEDQPGADDEHRQREEQPAERCRSARRGEGVGAERLDPEAERSRVDRGG
jgi:hypothetical protein